MLILSLLLIACKEDKKALKGSLKNTVGYVEFTAFKASVLDKISSNKKTYQNSQQLLSENHQKLSEKFMALDSRLLALRSKQQESSEFIVMLEKHTKAINKQQQSLSERLKEYASTKKSKQKKTKALQRFPFSLSSIAIWGNHYVVYMKVKGEYIPLRINDSLGNWQLTTIDYAMKRVVFKHIKTKQSIMRKLP